MIFRVIKPSANAKTSIKTEDDSPLLLPSHTAVNESSVGVRLETLGSVKYRTIVPPTVLINTAKRGEAAGRHQLVGNAAGSLLSSALI